MANPGDNGADGKIGGDASLFREAMADVGIPRKYYPQRRINQSRPLQKQEQAVRKKPFAHETESARSIIDAPDSGSPGLFVRPGMQRNIVKKLKRGQYHIDAVLDLHGLRKHEAEEALENFIADALDRNHQCVLIIHGKGFRSENKKGVLKPHTLNWLKTIPAVKAYSSAQQKHGGTGAVYVLLKNARTNAPRPV